ncbi:MAG TPA: transposase, partial [Steroidobacteraceae bacterium]
GNASKGSIVTRKRLAEQVAALERDIEAYGAALAENDAAEATAAPAQGERTGGSLAEQLAALIARRAQAKAALDGLVASGETQLSRTDADARLVSKRGQTLSGYNVQIAVDAKHKLIVASEVVNDGNDTGQLHSMAMAAKQAVEAETLTVVADTGYYNGETLRACETDGITAYVPPARHGDRLAAQGRFNHEAFRYDATADVYLCPAGTPLSPMNGDKVDKAGKRYVLYVSRRSACGGCPLRQRCLTEKAKRRTIYRWEHEVVLERHRARMAGAEAVPLMRRRAELAEHPFGTLKCRAGYRHFLLRGFNRVRGEWSLMALCYNFTRMLSIIGIDRFIAWVARHPANWPITLLYAALAACHHVTAFIARFHAATALYRAILPYRLHAAR